MSAGATGNGVTGGGAMGGGGTDQGSPGNEVQAFLFGGGLSPQQASTTPSANETDAQEKRKSRLHGHEAAHRRVAVYYLIEAIKNRVAEITPSNTTHLVRHTKRSAKEQRDDDTAITLLLESSVLATHPVGTVATPSATPLVSVLHGKAAHQDAKTYVGANVTMGSRTGAVLRVRFEPGSECKKHQCLVETKATNGSFEAKWCPLSEIQRGDVEKQAMCTACSQCLRDDDVVRDVLGKLFHANCRLCVECERPLPVDRLQGNQPICGTACASIRDERKKKEDGDVALERLATVLRAQTKEGEQKEAVKSRIHTQSSKIAPRSLNVESKGIQKLVEHAATRKKLFLATKAKYAEIITVRRDLEGKGEQESSFNPTAAEEEQMNRIDTIFRGETEKEKELLELDEKLQKALLAGDADKYNHFADLMASKLEEL